VDGPAAGQAQGGAQDEPGAGCRLSALRARALSCIVWRIASGSAAVGLPVASLIGLRRVSRRPDCLGT
jgi:hypothetical protein